MLDPTDHQRASDSPVADCCGEVDPRISAHFDNRIAELTAESEFPAMVDVSEMLLKLLDDVADEEPSLLELGCGSGALAVALLKRGATRVRGYDMSPGMLAVAVKRAEQADLSDRAAFTVADGARADVGTADWVVMDRVICCYPDYRALLANATRAATRRVAFTVPNSRGFRGFINRIGWGFENIPSRLFRRNECATFVHSIDRIEEILRSTGFRETRHDRLGLWYAAVWDRPSS
jgi:magnesium-protoporphyrin O-methyltransferase